MEGLTPELQQLLNEMLEVVASIEAAGKRIVAEEGRFQQELETIDW